MPVDPPIPFARPGTRKLWWPPAHYLQASLVLAPLLRLSHQSNPPTTLPSYGDRIATSRALHAGVSTATARVARAMSHPAYRMATRSLRAS